MGITTQLANTDHLPAPENSVVMKSESMKQITDFSPLEYLQKKKHSADDKIQSEGSSKRL